MKNKKFQAGGVIDEDELFADDTIPGAGDGEPAGTLDGELAGDTTGDGDPPAGDPPADPPAEPAATKPALGDKTDPEPDPPAVAGDPPDGEPAAAGDGEPGADDEPVELTGVEDFLTQYGVQGGLIKFEDGTEKRYADLTSEEQANVLNTLVKESVPTIEEKFNLDNSEVDLLNTIRESGRSTEDFINDVVDARVQAVVAQQQAASTDYTTMDADALFVKNLQDANPEITDDELASELVKAKELSTYNQVVDGIRKGYTAEQSKTNAEAETKANAEFAQELEAQRTRIVESAEEINDIAGAVINDDVKEFLLHDVMELNDNKDPILMEKIFSDPETMIKVNWFMNYGEDYISNLNTYWKKQVSIAAKSGYQKAVKGMPTSPTQGGQGGTTAKGSTTGGDDAPPNPVGFGKVLSEEELFNQ